MGDSLRTAMNIKNGERIKKWMAGVARDGSWQNYHDLHIDEIDALLEDRSLWVNHGCRCLNLANSVRRELGINLVVALGIELRSYKNPSPIIFKVKINIKKNLADSPPSLYL